jgi:NADH dehydrogenase
MARDKIVILGGSGFVGAHLANKLAAQGRSCRILTRDRRRTRHLWPLPNVAVVEVDVYDEIRVSDQLKDCSAVINLVGILNEKGDSGAGFRRAHIDLTTVAITASRRAGVKRYLHMSSLNADPFGASYYLRTKGESEAAVMASEAGQFHVTVFRPSVIFGPGDGFFERFAHLLRLSPLVFPLACAATKFQPVYVGDVADAMIQTLRDRNAYGRKYDLGGPQVKTLKEWVEDAADFAGLHRFVVPLGPGLSKLQANVLEYFPGKPFSRDNLRSTAEDSIVRGENGLDTLGIVPTRVGAVARAYLGRSSERARYDAMRTAARRR